MGAALLALATAGTPAMALVLCKKHSGALFVRNSACKKKESIVTAAQVGAVGPMGPMGPTGPAGGSLVSTLQSGQTESGACGLGFHASTGSDHWYAYQQFPIPLAAPIAAANTVLVNGSSATNCPGVGQAAPGFLCVYVTHTLNATGGLIFDVETGSTGASRYGFAVAVTSTLAGDDFLDCVYSVTAA